MCSVMSNIFLHHQPQPNLTNIMKVSFPNTVARASLPPLRKGATEAATSGVGLVVPYHRFQSQKHELDDASGFLCPKILPLQESSPLGHALDGV